MKPQESRLTYYLKPYKSFTNKTLRKYLLNLLNLRENILISRRLSRFLFSTIQTV
jgi:hypothetical protein